MIRLSKRWGNPLEDDLARVAQKTWGKALLSKEKKKALLKDLKFPENCKSMQPSKLNSEIYIRVHEQAQNKDRAALDRQKDITKAAIPLFHSIGKISAVESLLEKLLKRDAPSHSVKLALKGVKEVMPLLQQSIKVLNYNVTETTRKRRYDVCAALGNQFKSFAGEREEPSENLFHDDTMKRMKSELKKLPVKGGKAPYPKNGSGFGKSSRSYQSSGGNSYRNSYRKNTNNNQNNNNNNHNNNKN